MKEKMFYFPSPSQSSYVYISSKQFAAAGTGAGWKSWARERKTAICVVLWWTRKKRRWKKWKKKKWKKKRTTKNKKKLWKKYSLWWSITLKGNRCIKHSCINYGTIKTTSVISATIFVDENIISFFLSFLSDLQVDGSSRKILSFFILNFVCFLFSDFLKREIIDHFAVVDTGTVQ